MDKTPKQDKELESSQDVVKNQDIVDSLRVVKRTVENQEGFVHNVQGGSNKIPKLVSKAGISEKHVSEDSSRENLLKYNVQSVREADWNKLKEQSDKFAIGHESHDRRNESYLLSSLYSHVRGNCESPFKIYWKKSNFTNVTYFQGWKSWKKGIKSPTDSLSNVRIEKQEKQDHEGKSS